MGAALQVAGFVVGSRAHLGLALLQTCAERAYAQTQHPEVARWHGWLATHERPFGPPPGLGAEWREPRHDDEWLMRLPLVFGMFLPVLEAVLGREVADRLVLSAYQDVAHGAEGNSGLADLVRLLPARLLDAGEAALLDQIRDLEAARNAEAAARAQFEAVLDAVAEGILVTDEQGVIVLANAEAGRIFGVSVDGLAGRPLGSLLPTRWHEVHFQLLAQVSTDGTPSAGPEKRRLEGLRGGTVEFPLEMTLRAARLPDGQLRVTAAIRDLSASLAEQTRLALADRMVSVGTLAAGAAHEINNPLAYLTMNVEYVREALANARDGGLMPDLEESIEALDQALDGSRRVQAIVRDLRTFARADPRKGIGVDLQEALESALRMVANEMRPRARVESHFGGQFTVASDHARLCQVFLNVLHNAAQAIPPGAAHANLVSVSTERAPDHQVRISIRDTGTGIAPEHLDRVFDPFFTTKPAGQGLGLGLAICHTVVAGLGGHISLQPASGGGTEVVILLPATESIPLYRTPPPSLEQNARTILAIDDEPLVCRALSRALSEHTVTTETTGRRALARLAGGERFDVVLCDAQMPEMSAIQLYNAVASVRPELRDRFIFLTGGAQSPELRAFLARIPNLRLEKPIDLAALREAIEQICLTG